VIRLGAHDVIVLGYLKSCLRETITGGVIAVGLEQSYVENGKVVRTRVKCDGGKMQLNPEETAASAGMASRGVSIGNAGAQQAIPPESIRLYGRVPMVEVKRDGILLIERIDQPGEQYEITIARGDLVRGFFDLARARRVLTAGGHYRARFGGKEVVFAVDPSATTAAPLLARLLRF